MSDDFAKNVQGIIKRKKVAHSGTKTAKQAHKMRKVRVSLYFGRSFNKDGTAPLYICVNQASSSCYIMPDRRKVDDANKKVLQLLFSWHNKPPYFACEGLFSFGGVVGHSLRVLRYMGFFDQKTTHIITMGVVATII